MKWNTRSIINIDDEVFVGKYNGVDFEIEPGKTRFLPTEVSEHIAKQLLRKIERKEVDENRNTTYSPGVLIDKILGQEILTAKGDGNKSFREQVEDHEREFKKLQEQQKKKELSKVDEALKVAQKDV